MPRFATQRGKRRRKGKGERGKWGSGSLDQALSNVFRVKCSYVDHWPLTMPVTHHLACPMPPPGFSLPPSRRLSLSDHLKRVQKSVRSRGRPKLVIPDRNEGRKGERDDGGRRTGRGDGRRGTVTGDSPCAMIYSSNLFACCCLVL